MKVKEILFKVNFLFSTIKHKKKKKTITFVTGFNKKRK